MPLQPSDVVGHGDDDLVVVAKSTDTQAWRPACGAGAQVQDTAINVTRRQTRLRVALYQVVCPVERRLAERPGLVALLSPPSLNGDAA